MKINLIDGETAAVVEAIIEQADQTDMPLRKDGWQFKWQKLCKVEGALFYKVVTLKEPQKVEGLMMLTLMFGEMLYMNNIEVSPWNYSSNGKYENIAGCLLAYACYKSFELGRGNYLGFLSFDSKTKLIKLYQRKYGAIHASGHKMFFDPAGGKALISKYLGIQSNS
ncbi:MAG: hypothetical protein D6730_08930 [Bacteroidetes bacterium]|nr:MAG: hypothetical protein D6730_08930 [Bacteroidota bacterium]